MKFYRWHIAGAVSHIAGEVSHVYKQSGTNISNTIQRLPPPSNPKAASDVNNSLCVPIEATDETIYDYIIERDFDVICLRHGSLTIMMLS